MLHKPVGHLYPAGQNFPRGVGVISDVSQYQPGSHAPDGDDRPDIAQYIPSGHGVHTLLSSYQPWLHGVGEAK